MKLLFLILPLALLLLASCSKASTATNATQPTSIPTIAPMHFHKVGETVTVFPWEITLQSVSVVEPNSIDHYEERFVNLKPGSHFLVLNQHIKNISSKLQPLAGMQFNLQDKDGNASFESAGSLLGWEYVGGLGGPVSPSMQQQGQNISVVPIATHTFYWSYTTNDNKQQVMWEIDV